MILVFDTETTGFPRKDVALNDPSQPHIVQLAAALYDADGKEHGQFCALVKPSGWTVPEEARAVHGKTTEMLHEHGVSLSAALHSFGSFLTLAHELVAFNIRFDLEILRIALTRNQKDARCLEEGETLRHRCAMLGLTDLLEETTGRRAKWPKLTEAYRHFYQRDFVGAHDAMADVRACAAVHFALIGKPFRFNEAIARDDVDVVGISPADCPHRFSNGVRVEELAAECEYEAKMRRRVYARRVEEGTMTKEKAAEGIKLMHTAGAFFRNASLSDLQLS